MKVENIKFEEKCNFSATVNGIFLKIRISPNLVEDIKAGYQDQTGIPISEEDGRIMLEK